MVVVVGAGVVVVVVVVVGAGVVVVVVVVGGLVEPGMGLSPHSTAHG